MTDLLGFSLPQLGKISVVVGTIAAGAFSVGGLVTEHHSQGIRLAVAETTISVTETRLASLDERTKGMKEHLGNIQDDLRALRELVESAIRYSRFIPPKDVPHERALREPKNPN